jgi:hypothetical protein
MLTAKSFNLVSLLPQDDCPEVRHGFLAALKKALQQGRLGLRWYTLCFLTAFEPAEDNKQVMVRWLKNRAQYYRISILMTLTTRSKKVDDYGENIPSVTAFVSPPH